jgi:hypothetical protein
MLYRPGDRRGNKRSVGDDRAMWAAVAMQQHVTRDLMEQGRLAGVPRPTIQRDGATSLAQKMGLVPPPAPPPAEAEWTMAEAMSKYRCDAMRPCPICLESFSSDGGANDQTILSCSHVFHARCIAQLEKFAKQAGHRKQCPVCRRAGYFKRPHRGGKAQIQTMAVVKIQALFRGVLARKRYLALRLASNPSFRAEFYYKKLRRYADAMLMCSEANARSIDDILMEVDLRRAVAAAMMMTPLDWQRVRQAALTRGAESREVIREGTEWASTVRCNGLECPICLAGVQSPEAVVHQPTTIVLTREAAVMERVDTVAPPPAQPSRRRVLPSSDRWKAASSKPNSGPTALPVSAPHQRGPMRVVLPPRSEATVANATRKASGREGVLTSCGHVFHAQCLASFENYSQPTLGISAPPAVPHRCPVCRAAYVVQPLQE